MKKLLLGSALAALSAGTAVATDMPYRAPVYKSTAPAPFSWTGVYGGIHGGYGFGDYGFFNNNAGPPNDDVTANTTGGFGGFQLGYNSQFAPHWLIGGEIDLSFGDLKDRVSGVDGNGPTSVSGTVNYFGSARTRFGYVQDRVLYYVTGGAAWERGKISELDGAGGINTIKESLVGWTFGGGVEYAFDPRWSVKLEYLYADFGHNTATLFPTGNTVRTDLTMSTVRAGLNYRFGDGATPVAYMPSKAIAANSWTGSYLGLHGGYAWGDYDQVDGLTPIASFNLKPTGGYGGFQGGYNWQFSPNWLLGVETDTSFGDLKDNGSSGASSVSVKIDNFGTARARLGYVMDRTLVYATGGLAYAREKMSSSNAGDSLQAFHGGWTVGVGAEYKFDPNWSLKFEYLYADLGKFENTYNQPWKSTDVKLDTVRVGINYYGPVIERLFGGH